MLHALEDARDAGAVQVWGGVMLLQLITGMFDGIFGFVAGIFPDSPFGDLRLATQGMATGIGWLNWLFPVGDCMTLSLAACADFPDPGTPV